MPPKFNTKTGDMRVWNPQLVIVVLRPTSIIADGMYTFAIVANADIRRRYRVRRSTGAIQVFAEDGSDWHTPASLTADRVRRAIAAKTVDHSRDSQLARRVREWVPASGI